MCYLNVIFKYVLLLLHFSTTSSVVQGHTVYVRCKESAGFCAMKTSDLMVPLKIVDDLVVKRKTINCVNNFHFSGAYDLPASSLTTLMAAMTDVLMLRAYREIGMQKLRDH